MANTATRRATRHNTATATVPHGTTRPRPQHVTRHMACHTANTAAHRGLRVNFFGYSAVKQDVNIFFKQDKAPVDIRRASTFFLSRTGFGWSPSTFFLSRTRVRWTCPFWPSTFGTKQDKALKDAPLGSNAKQFLHILALGPTQKPPSRMSTGAVSCLKKS